MECAGFDEEEEEEEEDEEEEDDDDSVSTPTMSAISWTAWLCFVAAAAAATPEGLMVFSDDPTCTEGQTSLS